MARWLTVLAMGVVGTSLLQGANSTTTAPEFNIGLLGWDANQFFTATTNVTPTGDFTSGAGDGACFLPVGQQCITDPDPDFKINLGGDATDVGQTFSFSADGDGGGTLDFVNFGPDITNILITTDITDDEMDQFFTCSSNDFQFCGFQDPTGTLEILFSNPIAPIGSAAPEPTQYALLVIAFAAVVIVQRIRAQRASS